jgi:heptosyltransferase-1
MNPRHAPPKRILIVRISALGDIVFCTCLLEGLRRAYPSAYIAWLAEPTLAGVLEGDPRLSELIRLPSGALDGISGLRETRRFLAREPHFDWVIDAQGLFKSRVLARMVSARRRYGFASKEPGAFLMDRLHPKDGEPSTIGREYRFLAQQLTGGADPGPPRLYPSIFARERADSIMQSTRLEGGFVALCPFTTRPQKHWREPYWALLARRLSEAGLGPFALFGAPADREAANRILDGMPGNTVDLVGATRVPDLPALLERARIVIGVDTGLTHIGTAVRRPTIALFGSTLPYTRGAESPLRVLHHPLPCAPCRRNPTCGGEFMCMRDLKPERVADEALKLLCSSAAA